MTYAEAIQYLYDLQWFGTRLGLENSFKLAELAGNPHHRLRFIHVAGTNGKGSTCAMLESIYRTAGLRVGLFTSPHLVAFGERIQVNRRPISEADLVRQVEAVKPRIAQFPADSPPTFLKRSRSWPCDISRSKNATWSFGKPVSAAGWMPPTLSLRSPA